MGPRLRGVWIALVILAGALAPAGAEPAAAPAVPAAASSASLAQRLVGTWTHSTDSKILRTLERTRVEADGSFVEQTRIFVRGDTSKDVWAAVGSFTTAGTWSIDGDVLTQTRLRSTLPGMDGPTTDRFQVRIVSDESIALTHIGSRATATFMRAPAASERHAAAFRAAWPEPSADPAAWATIRTDDQGGTEKIDLATRRRDGDFAGVWMRSTMGPADVQASRRQAEALAREGRPAAVIDRVLIYFVVDCAEGLIKQREVRAFEGDRAVGGSMYEESDPLDWSDIGPSDVIETAVRERACQPLTPGRGSP